MKLVSNMKKLRFLDVKGGYSEWQETSYDDVPAFLSNELKYIGWSWYSASEFPESFKATKLVVIKLHNSLQKELWKGYMHLLCLKELEVDDAKHLVRTPDFSGLPCLQKLTLHGCHRLEYIDPSLGNHSRLTYISVISCDKLTRFPTIVWMEKLERLIISNCYSLCEFPGIETNMDSLIELYLEHVGIEVLPSSVGRCCTNLISLQLKRCTKLKCIEGNFRALKHLQKFKLAGSLEWLPKDLFDEKCCLEELSLDLWYYSSSNSLPPTPPYLPRSLRKLNLSGLRLKDGEIPCEIGEFSNLQELHLCANDFSRLSFSLLQFTQLKLLNLSRCSNLVELPELPSNLSILRADDCDSLEATKDDVHRNCKWLCQVSITGDAIYRNRKWPLQLSITSDEPCSFVGGQRLLETMLQGKAKCITMVLKGLEIAKGFEPRLVKRMRRCRLKLPENWFIEFSGFLFCCVSKECFTFNSLNITMRQEGYVLGIMDALDEQVFLGMKNNDHTWMGYVSFESLRCTSWWDKTSTAIDVSIDPPFLCDGFGARLVFKSNKSEETTATNNSSGDCEYKCKFNILHDTRSFFECKFETF